MRLRSGVDAAKVGFADSFARWLRNPLRWFLGISLSSQFLVGLGLVLSLALASLAYWINTRATTRLLDASADTAAFYMQNLLQPHVQTLGRGEPLRPVDLVALHNLTNAFRDQGHFLAIKIWSRDGKLIFSPEEHVVEAHPDNEIFEALEGNVLGRFPDLGDSAHDAERALGVKLYEIYAPLRDLETGSILAVGEFYQNADVIRAALVNSATRTWMFVAPLALTVFTMLFLIVRRGSLTIERQNAELRRQFSEREQLLMRNSELHRSIAEASQKAAGIDELSKRRIGLELHDGACQLLSYLVLEIDRLERVIRSPNGADASKAGKIVDEIGKVARDTMTEIRAISRGLVSPHLGAAKDLNVLLETIASDHKRRTGAEVALELAPDPPDLPETTRLTLGRIVQEALTNAAKHAPGSSAKIETYQSDGSFVIRVSDSGSDAAAEAMQPSEGGDGGLGLPGMTFRAQSLGGTLEFRKLAPRGAQVICRVPIEAEAD
ncbi:ATP-binding protein [Thioclava sp. L04-15]|uniref:sensor histidine kinase n=1 Tax=Thioclava sp. L04-15 TaxID=1915318 RepID=UPI00143ACC23|nr:ATP-binding protein [Thioclava sp. L04-15]